MFKDWWLDFENLLSKVILILDKIRLRKGSPFGRYGWELEVLVGILSQLSRKEFKVIWNFMKFFLIVQFLLHCKKEKNFF